jgi:CHASE1-domain containing sensor protein
VYAAFRSHDLFEQIFEPFSPKNGFDRIEVYDGPNVDSTFILFEGNRSTLHSLQSMSLEAMVAEVPLQLNHHTWTLRVSSFQGFVPRSLIQLPKGVGLGGSLITLLVLVILGESKKRRSLNRPFNCLRSGSTVNGVAIKFSRRGYFWSGS